MHTNVNVCRLEVRDGAIPKAVRTAVIEEISTLVNTKLSGTVSTMISRSLEKILLAWMPEKVAVVLCAMPQNPATVMSKEFHPICQKYLEQKFSQHLGHPFTRQQEVVLQRTVPATKISFTGSAQAKPASRLLILTPTQPQRLKWKLSRPCGRQLQVMRRCVQFTFW